MKKIMFVFGTRPEFIKITPVIPVRFFKAENGWDKTKRQG